jgi:hypothetical protein
VRNTDLKGKKLDILEKLERGKTISSEDIRASFSQSASDDHGSMEINIPEIPPFPGPFYYRDHEWRGHIISDSDLKEIHDQLHESLEEVRMGIESFRNSEDFIIMQGEFQKWSDKFRKELEKMKEELRKSERESGSKGTGHSLM